MTKNKGNLYICGTPIGNMKDITFRVLEILKKVDFIAAEDTRRTGKLLKHYDIKNELVSYHDHNEKERTKELLSGLKNGQDIALVSNAGMPGISDPGQILINEAVSAGIEVIPVPGPTAVIAALVASGLDMRRFVFEGFLPRSGKERKDRLRAVQREERTIIIYESPHRVEKTLSDLNQLISNRKISLIREISKLHEEKIRGTCKELLSIIKKKEIKGELVLVIEGHSPQKGEKEGWEDMSVVEHVRFLMKSGYSKKRAIKEVARLRELSKSDVYKKAVVIDAREYLE
ncbi:MAG: 16S rRNA (cytidine(1402)-2'-O)-methyltransferase [Halanaerobiales bacterium]